LKNVSIEEHAPARDGPVGLIPVVLQVEEVKNGIDPALAKAQAIAELP
jgi:hypothetical protein